MTGRKGLWPSGAASLAQTPRARAAAPRHRCSSQLETAAEAERTRGMDEAMDYSVGLVLGKPWVALWVRS